jgi:hypothetical protein
MEFFGTSKIRWDREIPRSLQRSQDIRIWEDAKQVDPLTGDGKHWASVAIDPVIVREEDSLTSLQYVVRARHKKS